MSDWDNSDDFWNEGMQEPSSTDTDDYWGSSDNTQSNSDDYWGSSDNTQSNTDDYWSTQDGFRKEDTTNPNNQEKPPIQTNLGYKSVAIIVVLAFIVLALVLTFVNGIRVKKKPSNTTQQTTQQQTQVVQTQNEGTTLITIPDTTHLDYTGDIYESSGKVTGKQKYLIGNQVVYDLILSINAGASTQRVDFYCTYSAYQSCNIGDLIKVKYQVVEEGYISVNEINK